MPSTTRSALALPPVALLALFALPAAGAPASWTEAPVETLADAHRVREGHASDPAARAADAERAARGEVVGATPAHEALRRSRPPLEPESRIARRDAHPLPFAHPDLDETWIADLGVLLRRDRDGDGFFGAVDLSIDVDTSAVEREVYLVVDLRDSDGVLTLSHATRAFTVRGNAGSDEYRLEIELLDNHASDYRDVLIEVRDAWTDTLLDTVSAHDFTSLAALPLEAEREHGPVDAGGHRPDDESNHGFGVLLTGSSSHEDHGYHDDGVHHDGDAYVAGYAASGGPLAALVLLALTGLRRLSRIADARRRTRLTRPDTVRRSDDFL